MNKGKFSEAGKINVFNGVKFDEQLITCSFKLILQKFSFIRNLYSKEKDFNIQFRGRNNRKSLIKSLIWK